MMKRLHRALIGVTVVTLALGLACSKKSIEPEPVGYNIYVNATNVINDTLVGTLYVFDSESLEIIDSIPDVGDLRDLVATQDGRWLFGETAIDDGRSAEIIKIDLQIKQIVDRFTAVAFGHLLLIDDDKLLIRVTCGLEFIDPDQFRIIDEDTIGFCKVSQPPEGHLIIGSDYRNRSQAIIYDTRKREIVRRFTPTTQSGDTINIATALMHPDGRRAIIIGFEKRVRRWFLIYDIESDSTIFQHRRTAWIGELAVTSDGSRAVTTVPAELYSHIPDGNVDVYDLDIPTHLKRFSSYNGISSFSDQIGLLENKAKIIVAPKFRSRMIFSIIDPVDLSVSTYFPDSRQTQGAIAVGPRFQ